MVITSGIPLNRGYTDSIILQITPQQMYTKEQKKERKKEIVSTVDEYTMYMNYLINQIR